jgi:nucleotide-binding universal stress UspA family protein
MMRSILLPFHDDDIDQAALDTALLVAGRYQSYIEGLFVWQPPQIIAGAGEGITLYGDYVTQIAAEGREMAGQAKERFSAIMAERGIKIDSGATDLDGIRAGWFEGEGLEDRVVGDYGRVFDLIIISRTGKSVSGDWQAACEAALFESGRPILLAPPQAPKTIGRNILIAWNGSTETAGTVALGMPFLEQAEAVTVLTVEEETVPGPSGEQLTRCLARNGLNVQSKTVSQQGRPIGQAILDEVSEQGIDLIFKGAYTQSRLRQMIFGGATRRILSHANVPVLMAH